MSQEPKREPKAYVAETVLTTEEVAAWRTDHDRRDRDHPAICHCLA